MNNVVNNKAVVINASKKLALVVESETEKTWNNIVSWNRIYYWDNVPVIFAFNEKEFAHVIKEGYEKGAYEINIPSNNMLKPQKLTITIPCICWERNKNQKENNIIVAEIFRYHSEKTIIKVNSEVWEGNKYSCEKKENKINKYDAETDTFFEWNIPNVSKKEFIEYLKKELVVVNEEKTTIQDTLIFNTPWFGFYEFNISNIDNMKAEFDIVL